MTDPSVQRFVSQHDWSGTPEELMTRRCEELLAEVGASVPVNVRALASLRGAVVEEVDQEVWGWIGPDGERLVIRVRSTDIEARRRFTVCHEVCHTFFPDFAESPRERAELEVERFDERDPIEYICDVGASELLLPRVTFDLLLPDRFAIDHILRLADHFRASIEASARRAVGRCHEPAAIAVLERASAPTAGSPLPRGKPRPEIERFRVRWASSHDMPHIPRPTSIPDDSEIARAVDGLSVSYRGTTDLLPGTFDVEVRSLPYERAGQNVARLLVLVRP